MLLSCPFRGLPSFCVFCPFIIHMIIRCSLTLCCSSKVIDFLWLPPLLTGIRTLLKLWLELCQSLNIANSHLYIQTSLTFLGFPQLSVLGLSRVVSFETVRSNVFAQTSYTLVQLRGYMYLSMNLSITDSSRSLSQMMCFLLLNLHTRESTCNNVSI